MSAVTYNERSWAIDLIGLLKELARRSYRSIRDVGGEQTVRTEGGSLFPDVLLFGDLSTAKILQGWELKMPDTSIDDPSFRGNAEAKARALGLDSFVLWNVRHARLYGRDPAEDEFTLIHSWDSLADITTRSAVVENRLRWEALAEEIFGHLNDLFDRGSLRGRRFIDAYRSGGVTALIMENAAHVAEAIAQAAYRDANLRSEIALWWDRYRAEYAKGERDSVLARAVISNWIGKLLFGQILREVDSRAHTVAEIGEETTPEEALEIFAQVSAECNFWTIFSNSVALDVIPSNAWSDLKQFNALLSDLRIGSVDQSQLSNVLEATVEVAVRKLRGQYTTPVELARLLVALCIRDITTDRILDPCCGSGTIARAALEHKLDSGLSADAAAADVFAGDQDPQAVQISTFSLTKPGLMHVPLRIYQRDVFELAPDVEIEFRNPTDGTVFRERLGQFNTITSNLPFVAQAGRAQYGNALAAVVESMGGEGQDFSGRADVAAYLPFKLHPLLADGGCLGIIITNAWLGTAWGDDFYEQIDRYYRLTTVITSGAGRWFKNSDVVANILLLDKKTNPGQPNGDVQFVVLTRPIEEIEDAEAVELAAAQIRLGQTQNETMTIRSVSPSDMVKFRKLGLGGNAQFVDCDWVLDLPIVPLNTLYRVRRGERRGYNAFFYPAPGHGIEDEYIRPLAKGPAAFKGLLAAATREAFSCSRTENELAELGHTGALDWIRRFSTPGVIAKLTRGSAPWYEMKADSLTDLVMFINYGDRLFVGRVTPPAFVDQRLVRLEPKADVDIDLCHALLNSSISMFFIEGMGFGRGLGALDLSKDRIDDFMHILDPSKLDASSVSQVKQAFHPLLSRDVMSVADELEQEDRRQFDSVILEVFGIDVPLRRIYDSLLSLVEIRLTATS